MASKWSLSTGPSGCTLHLALEGSHSQVMHTISIDIRYFIDMQMWNTIGSHDGRGSDHEKLLPLPTPFTSSFEIIELTTMGISMQIFRSVKICWLEFAWMTAPPKKRVS